MRRRATRTIARTCRSSRAARVFSDQFDLCNGIYLPLAQLTARWRNRTWICRTRWKNSRAQVASGSCRSQSTPTQQKAPDRRRCLRCRSFNPSGLCALWAWHRHCQTAPL